MPTFTSCCRYKARSYRARSVRDPRAVLKEFGTTLPESTTIHVMDSNADSRREAACQTRSSILVQPAAWQLLKSTQQALLHGAAQDLMPWPLQGPLP